MSDSLQKHLQASDLDIVPLDLTAFAQTHALVHSAVRQELASAVVGGLWSIRSPNRIHLAWAGRTRWGAHHAHEVSPETRFDLSSVSKVLGTWALFARLSDRGWLKGEAPLCEILPGAQGGPQLRLEHLLSHTSGFEAFGAYWKILQTRFAPIPLHRIPVAQRQRAMRDVVLGLKPENPPGVKRVYSDVGFLNLGWALEEVSGLSLDQAVQRWVWDDLGIDGARYGRTLQPPAKADPDVAATENCPWRGAILQGQVHDDNCWAMGGYAGHSGAFARASDVLHFARALFAGTFSAKMMDRATHRVLAPMDCDRTWGWDTPSGTESAAGTALSAPGVRAVGHLGFTGTSLWIDMSSGIAVVLLTNRVHPSRDKQGIKTFRIAFHNALFDELKKSLI